MTEGQFAQTGTISGVGMDRRVAAKRPRRLWIAAGAAAVLAVVLAWRLLPAAGSTDVARSDLEIGVVQRGPFEDYLPVRATAAPETSTLVAAVSGGQVEKLLVQDGAAVHAGQPIAVLANPTLKLDVLTREAGIASQLGGLTGEELMLERSRVDRDDQTATANYDLVKARRELRIRQQLHDHGYLSDQGLESYRAEVEFQEARLAQLKTGKAAEDRMAAVQAARLAETRQRLSGNLDAVRAGLDDLTVRAPANGRLSNFTIQPGQMLKAGDSVGQVDSEDAWKLIADVDEYYLGRVTARQAATAAGGITLAVAKVLPAVSEGRFRVELGFKGPPPSLRRGQAMDVRVTLGATADVLWAPVGGWLESGGGAFAFVLDADGRHARRRPVKIGRRNPEQAEILSGLAPADRLVTSNLSSIKGDVLNLR